MAEETTETTEETEVEENEETAEGSQETETEEASKETDWKREARKHERRAKKTTSELDELRKKLKDREDEDKSEQEKAIEDAKEEARNEALSEAEEDRRSDRLEVAVSRLASKGVTIGEGDEAKTVRFDDPEDAQIYIERALASGDLDASEIYDDEGKPKADVVTEFLTDLLTRKPKLAADGEKPKPGDPDTRKGETAKNDLEAMTPEDHAKRKYGVKK